MLRNLALISILIVTPHVTQAKGGGARARLARITSSLSKKVPAALHQARSGINKRYASFQQNRLIKRNIKELRRASPKLDEVYLQASKSFKRSNRSSLVIGAGGLVQTGVFGTIAAGNYATGNPVMGTAFAAGSGSAAILSGQLFRSYYRGARLSGQRALMEKVGGSETIRRQVGDKILPATASAYVAHFEAEQKSLNASTEAAKQKIASNAEKMGLSKRVVAALQGLAK